MYRFDLEATSPVSASLTELSSPNALSLYPPMAWARLLLLLGQDLEQQGFKEFLFFITQTAGVAHSGWN
jgi:hypothetical protein